QEEPGDKKVKKELFPEQPILMVDDEKHFLNSLYYKLRLHGITNVECCQDSLEVMPKLKERKYSVILLDILMPHMRGDELLPDIVAEYPKIPVIVITAFPDAKTADDCMEKGAFDCLTKPIDIKELVRAIHDTLDLTDTHKDIIRHKKQLFSNTSCKERNLPNVITCCGEMLSICQTIGLVAFTSRSVLVMGETGVGKEFLAGEIHKQSHRKGKFIPFETTGLNDEEFARLIFGYRTTLSQGAAAIIEGDLEKAGKGTLYINEIGDLSMESQARLLRLLQNREYCPVGSDKLKPSRARIVAGTAKNLSALIQTGAFRYDLYNHLKAHEIHIPPLRERKEDIPLLVDYFLGKAAAKVGIEKPALPKKLLPLLEKYHFPGNVGELKKMVNHAVSRFQSGILSPDDFFRGTKEGGE
ncbi:MAG: sigma-54-dependent Fis family transcriptional regulator, partial [Candidatus Aminicenantes bacterium]